MSSDPESRDETLRRRAEARVSPQTVDVSDMQVDEVRALVLELQVHQAELEIQNEDLRATQLELSETKDLYFDLFDLAPVGYLSLNASYRVVRANLTAATLFGVDRAHVLGVRLEELLAAESRDDCYRALRAENAAASSPAPEVGIDHPDGARRFVQMTISRDARAVPTGPGFRIALTDITERRALEAEKARIQLELKASEQDVQTLRSLLPMCASCRRVRNDEGYWRELETYVRESTTTKFSHGLCASCVRRLYPEFADEVIDRGDDSEEP